MDIRERGKDSRLDEGLLGLSSSEPCRLHVSNLMYKPARTISGMVHEAIISRFPYPIHCLSPPHADEDSRCALGYAVKKTGGFHIVVSPESSKVLLRLLMTTSAL